MLRAPVTQDQSPTVLQFFRLTEQQIHGRTPRPVIPSVIETITLLLRLARQKSTG